MSTKATLSVSIDPELKAMARVIAREQKTTPSGLVSRYIRELASKRREALVAEYYDTMAHEHREFAQKSIETIQEIASSWGD